MKNSNWKKESPISSKMGKTAIAVLLSLLSAACGQAPATTACVSNLPTMPVSTTDPCLSLNNQIIAAYKADHGGVIACGFTVSNIVNDIYIKPGSGTNPYANALSVYQSLKTTYCADNCLSTELGIENPAISNTDKTSFVTAACS